MKTQVTCFLILYILAMPTACKAPEQSAEQRMRTYFKIESSAPLTKEVIRRAILHELPVGTTEEAIYAYIQSAKIGSDHLSSYSPSVPRSEQNEIVIRIEYDPKEANLTKKHYALIFYLDKKRQLKDIEVKEWLTGL